MKPADRTHHGKEEDILFRELGGRGLSAEHRSMMITLIEEHKIARRVVGSLARAREEYLGGNQRAIEEIRGSLKHLAQFYPAHIEKEDKQFFYPCMEYFTTEEQDGMLEEFREFDRSLIHEKYQSVVDGLENSAVSASFNRSNPLSS